ncbi:hypothetical protein [Actinomycetospora flava]|uniref:PhoD-like phosphatase n=1 Tax=Actinomycetospora flava TaxID=3129232 RepID=A0ABU8MEY9_9PSEU
MEPGVLVTQKDAWAESVLLWVGAFVERDTDTIRAGVSVADIEHPLTLSRYRFDSERRITGFSTTHNFYHSHVVVPVPGGARDLPVTASVLGGPTSAPATVSTLPRAVEQTGEPLDLVTASCYDLGTDYGNSVDTLWNRTIAEAGRRPDLTLLIGDQVYLDAPWWFFGALARHTPRTYYLMKYWRSWGGEQVRALRSVMTTGPTWFVPDDHEFWNNWPHFSATAFHSFGNIGEFIKGALVRHNPTNWWRPAQAAEPENAAQQQIYSPVHPNEWDGWSRGAFDLFGSFQTRTRGERVGGTIPLGETAEGHQPPAGPEPLNDLFQHVDLGPVQVALLDTRTRRSRSHRNAVSQFTDPDALDAMLEVARRAEVFVLAVAQPILSPAMFPRQRGWRMLLDHSLDRGINDYWTQYERFWRGLFNARAGRPTVALGGDVHHTYLAYAPALSLVQVVASPLSLVRGFGPLDALSTAWTQLKRRGDRPILPRVEDLFAGPSCEAAPAAGQIDLLSWFRPGQAGVAHVRFEHQQDTNSYTLRVSLRRRDPGEGPDQVTCFRLHTTSAPALIIDDHQHGPGGRVQRQSDP